MKITEKNIPELIRTGHDQQVISLLYKTIFPKVKKYITFRGGIADDASDVFQDAIICLYDQIMSGKYNEEKYSVFGYLFRLAINRWINKIKKHRKTSMVEDFDEMFEEFPDPANFDLADKISREEDLLKKFFSGVGEKCIELLSYQIFSNLLWEDVAIRMGFSSVGAVKMQVKRCREKLNDEMERNPDLMKRLFNELG